MNPQLSDNDISFRSPERRHLEGLASLFSAIVENGDDNWFHPHPFTLEQAEGICDHPGPDYYCIALVENVVVGYGYLRGWEEGYDIPTLGICISPGSRGNGFAKIFMHHLHDEARKRKAKKIMLKVYAQNTPAFSMYTSLGYVFSETIDGQHVGHLDI